MYYFNIIGQVYKKNEHTFCQNTQVQNKTICHGISKFYQGKLSPDQGEIRGKSGNLIFKNLWPPWNTTFTGNRMNNFNLGFLFCVIGGNADGSPKKKYTLSADAPVFVPKFAMQQQYYQVGCTLIFSLLFKFTILGQWNWLTCITTLHLKILLKLKSKFIWKLENVLGLRYESCVQTCNHF